MKNNLSKFILLSCLFCCIAGVASDRLIGDTIETAIEITIPYSGTGSTTGYEDDYDVMRPFDSWSPDVVYSVTPDAGIGVVIDLFGSDYDTKVFVYDSDMNVIACNDDWYPSYVSRLECVSLDGGVQYYIVIDAYSGSGNYILNIYENTIEIPGDAMAEGEPTLYQGYIDEYNSGCNYSSQDPLVQMLYGDQMGMLTLHGHSGVLGVDVGDSDWFGVEVGNSGEVTIEFQTQMMSYFWVSVIQPACPFDFISSCYAYLGSSCSVTINEPAGSEVCVGVSHSGFYWSGFDDPEFSYLLSFTGISPQNVSNDDVSWGTVKALFR